jgi:propanol-preferring alcohol dehydrogenase
MLSARIHEYKKPLVFDELQVPLAISGEQVLLKVAATGLCHSDLHLIDGEFKDVIPLNLPSTPGHEVAGWVEKTGDLVPQDFVVKDDLAAVFAGWSCGVCLCCKSGDEQLCNSPRWPGVISNGGFSEYILVPSYRFLVKVDKKFGIQPEYLAPLTDAGVTPYRAIKKVKNLLGPGKSIGILGIGGLGSYGIQYAKILSAGSVVIALGRNNQKLELAREFGADYSVNIKDKTNEQVRHEIKELTHGRGIDVVLDTVGLENTTKLGFDILSKRGALVLVGLFGKQINIPAFPAVANEYQFYGSLWGNYNELAEVIELAKIGKIRHHVEKFGLREINDAIHSHHDGKIVGRAVIMP